MILNIIIGFLSFAFGAVLGYAIKRDEISENIMKKHSDDLLNM